MSAHLNWMAIDNGLQLVSALAWLGVVFRFSGCIRRVFLRTALPRDAAGVWACLTGVSQILFTLRWLWLGASDMRDMSTLSLQVWAVCYVVSAACAVGLLHTLQERTMTLPYLDTEANARARVGLMYWMAITVASILLAWVAQ